MPLGALALLRDGRLSLAATVCALDGRRALSAQGESAAGMAEAVALGIRVAEQLLAQGAAELIALERSAHAVEEP